MRCVLLSLGPQGQSPCVHARLLRSLHGRARVQFVPQHDARDRTRTPVRVRRLQLLARHGIQVHVGNHALPLVEVWQR
jgi:hypothetical protein